MSDESRVNAAGSKGVPRARREQLILDAATMEFGRLGYPGASLAVIASWAGVSKQLVLNYFGTKDALYVACAERAAANLIEPIERVLAAGEGPVPMAEATLDAIFGALAQRPHDWTLLLDETAPDGSRAAATVAGARATIADQAARGVRSLAEAEEIIDADDLGILTSIWMSFVSATVGWWLRHPDRSAAEMRQRSRRAIAVITSAASRPGGHQPDLRKDQR